MSGHKNHLRKGSGINRLARACNINPSKNARFAALMPGDFFEIWKYNKDDCCAHCLEIFKNRVAKARGVKR